MTWNRHLEPEAVPRAGSWRRGRRPGAVPCFPASLRLMGEDPGPGRGPGSGADAGILSSEAAGTGGGGLATHREKGSAAADANETCSHMDVLRGECPFAPGVRLK